MNKPVKMLMVALAAIILSSCAAIREQSKLFTPVNMSAIQIGMTRTEVENALNKKPDNTVAAERNPDNNEIVEIVQYSQWETIGSGVNASNRRVESYWLYFVNNKLDRWHKIRTGDKNAMDFRHGDSR